MPFHFAWHGRSPSRCSLSPEHWQSNPVHEDQMSYCVQVREILGEAGGSQLPPSHAQTSLFIANMFQDGHEEQFTEAVGLGPRGDDLGQSANLQGWKDQGCCDLPFLVVGHSYFPLPGLGQPTLVTVHLLVITGVPWRPCQEFRWGCYLNQHLTDIGWALWCGDDFQHPL